jgi:hypothetical protein
MKVRILTGLALAAVLWGQPAPEPGDAPGRVGRLSFVHGSVQFRPDAVQEWTPATLNYPLSNGDHLWTDSDAQAEVHVGLTAVHIAPETGFFISLLDDRAFHMGLAEGALNIRIPRMNEGEAFEVETPYGKFRLLRTGSYRVDVQPEGDYASVIVRSGAAEAVAGGQSFAVAAGQRAVLTGKPAVVELMDAPAPDPWDEWCAARDEQAERGYEKSQQYVSWEISGAADFADYGDWQSDDEYGWCWIPRGLPAGWAPYRFGHWIWKGPWGWTWVDQAPWGFAVSHWGRWTRTRKEHWAWVPDPKRFQPRYSPAHVAFSRTDGSLFVSWLPLAPGETAGRTRNFRNREAVTAAAQNDFVASRAIAAARLLVLDRGATEFTARTAEIMPTRDSILGGRALPGGPPQRKNAQPVAAAPDARQRDTADGPQRFDLPRRDTAEAPQRLDLPRRDTAEAPQRLDLPRRDTAEAPQRLDLPRRDTADAPQRLDLPRRDTADAPQRLEVPRRVEAPSARDEEQRRAERLRQEAEEQQREQERRRVDDERRTQRLRQEAEEHQREQERRQERQRRDDEDRQRQAEQQRRADDQRRQEESRRQADDHRRQEESRRQADDQRRQDESRRAEEGRRADEQRRADESRRQQAEQQRQQEQQRANETRKK